MRSEAPWKIGMNTFWWENLERADRLEACIDTLVEIGYEAVEFKVDSFGAHPNGKAVEAAADAARRAGLEVSNLVILRNLSQRDAAERGVNDVAEATRICSSTGIGALNFTTGGATRVPVAPGTGWWRPSTRQDPEAWDTLARSLGQLVRVADRERVDLAVEACVGNLVRDFGTTMEMLARCDHPRLMLTFDPSHYLLAREDIDLAIRRLASRIRHVHFKDAVGRVGELGPDFIFPFPGQGGIDWSSFFTVLRDVGYRGVLSVEFESFGFMEDVYRRDPVPAARLCKQAADALLGKWLESENA